MDRRTIRRTSTAAAGINESIPRVPGDERYVIELTIGGRPSSPLRGFCGFEPSINPRTYPSGQTKPKPHFGKPTRRFGSLATDLASFTSELATDFRPQGPQSDGARTLQKAVFRRRRLSPIQSRRHRFTICWPALLLARNHTRNTQKHSRAHGMTLNVSRVGPFKKIAGPGHFFATVNGPIGPVFPRWNAPALRQGDERTSGDVCHL